MRLEMDHRVKPDDDGVLKADAKTSVEERMCIGF